ncbi:transcription termination factor 5, mitochondrial isoform X2 [Diachasma alloeum]|uniref:transcription termination factor 5, mitochondrial isoform X2 n=1 Tax=Diachasma alloeum TaxID=454923 RepID=UPI0007383C8F|nr:transcription termination factor 5, mitochondrial isoform X2 [Diachasma alloeum]
MHRVVTTRVLLAGNLKHDYCCCVRMYSKLQSRWRECFMGFYSTDFKIYKQLVADNLGMDRDHAGFLLRNNMRIIGIDQQRIVRNCDICQKEDVDLQDSVRDLKFLELSEDDLVNRILLLKEMGAQYISTGMLRTCASRAHVATFKAYTKIPNDAVISENLYSHLHEPPPDVPALTDVNDYMTVKEYRKRCLIHWLKWRLEIPDTNHRLLQAMVTKLRYKSFSRLRMCFDILHDELGMSVQSIREKKCLSYVSSGDLRQILTHIPEICGVPIRHLLVNHLCLLKIKYHSVLITKQALEDFGITSEQLLKTPRILLMNADAVEDGVQRRMEYLRYLSIGNASVNILGSSKVSFDRYLRTGMHRFKGEEMAVMLKKHLRRDTDEIQEGIKRHPMWKHVDLVTIHDTMQYLLKSFDADDIFRNIQLLLYSRDKIQYPLARLIEVNKQIDEKYRFTPSQLLALCAYHIEREYHFTGDGVWDSNQKLSKKSPEELNGETEEWKEYQKEYTLNDVNTLLFINTNKTERLP